MDGLSTGVVATDCSRPDDHGGRVRDACQKLRAAKEAVEAFGCWRLTREIEDEITRLEATCPAREGERGGEEVHGEHPEETPQVALPLVRDPYKREPEQ